MLKSLIYKLLTRDNYAGDAVRWDALSSAGSGALQNKRSTQPHAFTCKRAKSTPDLSQAPSATEPVEDIPLLSALL